MIMKIEITNEEKKVKVCFRRLRGFVTKVFKVLGLPKESELGVVFVTQSRIKELNKIARKKDSVTDVLSFPSADFEVGETIDYETGKLLHIINPENNHIYLGEIVLCTTVAQIQAKEFGHSLEAEVYRLIVHSVLHLIGYDHETDKDYGIMHRREIEVLQKLGYNFSI